MPVIEVAPGVSLYALDLGAGDPVVLVPGFGMTHEAWDRQARVLAESGHRVVAMDQRGHGRSDKPLDGYDVDTLASDLLSLIRMLDIETCAVVGWSFGGQVGFRLAALEPDLVNKLVLVGSNAVRASRSEDFPFGGDSASLLDSMLTMELADRFSARRITIRSGFASEPDPAVLQWMVGQSLAMPSWAAVACYRSMLETDLVGDIPAVSIPVLQVIGEKDPVHSARGAEWLSERLADARLVSIPECGHYPMLEAPELLDLHLIDFLRN